jgi:uncharacterized protein with PIN domain
MIVDTSALIAILRDEPQAETFAHAIESSSVRRLSAVTSSKPQSSLTPVVIQSPAVGSMT